MRKPLILSVFCICLLAGSALAAVGRIDPVGVGLEENVKQLLYEPFRVQDSKAFGKPVADSGCVNPKAIVIKLTQGDAAVAVAIDTLTAKDRIPNVARIDFTGKGQFADATAIDLKIERSSGRFRASFGPTVTQVSVNGVAQPVRIEGQYYKWGPDQRYFNMKLVAVRQGECRFGEKVYPIRLIDGNNNLTVNDGMVLAEKYGRQIKASGDTILLGDKDGTFAVSNPKAVVGNPILVDGTWYEVTISDDASTVSAAPVEAEFGAFRIDHDYYWVRLVGKNGMFIFDGDRNAIPLPAGEYEIVRYGETIGDPEKAVMMCQAVRTPAMVTVEAGKTAEVAAGTPMTIKVKVKVRGRRVTAEVAQFDAAGLEVETLVVAPNRYPPRGLRFKAIDEAGKVVHQGKFEYG